MKISKKIHTENIYLSSNNHLLIKERHLNLHIKGYDNIIVLDEYVNILTLEGNNNHIIVQDNIHTKVKVLQLIIQAHSNFIENIPCEKFNVEGNNNIFNLNSCSIINVLDLIIK